MDDSTTPNLEKRQGGRGSLASVIEDLADPHRARGTAGLIVTALRDGTIDLFSIDYGMVRREATLMTKSADERVKSAGAKLLVAMANHDAKMIEVADKSIRLDAGGSTENIDHRFVSYVKGIDESKI